MEEKEKLLQLIESVNNSESIRYLYQFTQIFISRHSVEQTISQSEEQCLADPA